MRRLTLLLMLGALLCAPAAADAAKRHRCLPYGSTPRCFMWTGKVTFVADGDTVYVNIDGDGSRRSFPVRITGINATEQTTYSSRASQRRGECHALEPVALQPVVVVGEEHVLARGDVEADVARLARPPGVGLVDHSHVAMGGG